MAGGRSPAPASGDRRRAVNAKQIMALKSRHRRLPGMLQAARRRVIALEREAARYGMHELVSDPRHVNSAWDRALEQDRLRGEL